MKFKYKINLEVDIDFEAPLLGVDTTKGKRSRINMIAKSALAEMIKFNATSFVDVNRQIDEDGLTGSVKGSIMLRSHNMLEQDKSNDICPIHSILLKKDGSCKKCLEENNK